MASRSFQPAGLTTETYTPDNLIAGDNIRPITRSITLVSGQNVQRGAVLGIITASGKYTLSTSALTNGAQTPKAIAAEDMDATGGDKTLQVYIAGEFNEREIVLGSGHTADSIRETLRDGGIYLKPSEPK